MFQLWPNRFSCWNFYGGKTKKVDTFAVGKTFVSSINKRAGGKSRDQSFTQFLFGHIGGLVYVLFTV